MKGFFLPGCCETVSLVMALRKQKKYNWKETNLEFFGSDLEKKVTVTKGVAICIIYMKLLT